jgi:hypothetical protein
MNVHDPYQDITWMIRAFTPISLDKLNEDSAMMSRIDNKYVVDRGALVDLMPCLIDHFDVLEIQDCRAFGYETRYFDDKQNSAYYEHHQGLRKGFKVRVRRYLDANLCYLEVKVKGRRGMTEKYRLPYNKHLSDHLTQEACSFARETYFDQYGKTFAYDLQHALDVRYRRITLVAKSGGERMTLDTNLLFSANSRSIDVGSDVYIIETKSALGRGFADILLREAGQRPVKKCSKYCIGMAALGKVNRFNLFLPTMRKLKLLPSSKAMGLRSGQISDFRSSFDRPRSISHSAAA